MPQVAEHNKPIEPALQPDVLTLDLSGTVICGFSEDQIRLLQKVEKVCMKGAIIQRDPFPTLNECPNLKVVDLSDTRLGEVPEYRGDIKVILDRCPIAEIPSWVLEKSIKPSFNGCPMIELPEGYEEFDPELAADILGRRTDHDYDCYDD